MLHGPSLLNHERFGMRPIYGFTLIEVLVAVVVVGLAVTLFSQLTSTSMNLQVKARERLGGVMTAREVFAEVMQYDVRTENFPWSGESAGNAWRLEIFPVRVAPEEAPESEEEEFRVKWTHEVYGFRFTYFRPGGEKFAAQLVRYKLLPVGFFSDEFLEENVSELASVNASGE